MTDQNSQFFAILTAIGEAKQANADALGVPWTFSHMGVGDANGTDPIPDRLQTSLINERRKAPLNQLKVDPNNASIIIAEQVIPPDAGGWWIREIGLYDADGDLVAVANCAPSFKPLLSQGTGKTQVVRLNLIVTSTANVTLKIDPAVVLATRDYVTEELAKRDFKHSVLAATTAAITLSGLQTVDGVALTAGARVLVKNQAAAKDNGLYLVATGAWTRCPDADTSAKVTPGLLVLVERGTANGDSAWQLITDGPITLGVTALAFEMAFGRSGVAAGTYRSVKVDAYGRVVAATNPTTVAGYGLTDVYTQTQVNELVQSVTIRATQAEAEAGTESTKVMTPLRVFQAIAKVVVQATETVFGWAKVATQAQVTTGTDDATIITPKKLRAAQATQAEAEAGADNTKVITPLRALQAAIKQLNNVGLAINSAPPLATFQAIVSGGLYRAFGANAGSSATPAGPPTNRGSLIGVVAITPRLDVTYYLAVEHGTNPADRKFWLGQYWLDDPNTVYWSELLTTDKIATQVQVNAGTDDATIVTPKKMRNGFSVLLEATGYIALPSWLGGWILQWVNGGSMSSIASGGSSAKTLTWPLAWPTGPLVPWVTCTGATSTEVGMVATTSGMTASSIVASVYNSTASAKSVQSVIAFCIGR